MCRGVEVRRMVLYEAIDDDRNEVRAQVGMVSVRLRQDGVEGGKVGGEDGIS